MLFGKSEMSLLSYIQPSNLRIGTKLAVTSGLAIVLVVAIVGMQWMSGRDIQTSTAISRLQVGVFSDALSAQAALRGMQIGVRDIRLAASKDALQIASNRMEELAKIGHSFVDPLAQKSLYPENKARFTKVGSLIDEYAAGAKEVAGLQAGILDLSAKLATDGATAAPQLSQLREQQKRIVTERTLPTVAQAEETLDAAIAVARKRTAQEEENVEAIVSSTQRNAMILGLLTVVLLIGSAVFGAFNIARPLRALVVPLLRMAKGEAVELPGTERQDEIGETARAVNDIKVMLAEKARREAEAKIEQDKQAEAERQAVMKKMADEFEAAVGGIVQAAVAGDFSQRVATSGKTGLVLNVGTAINSMCDNVGKALADFDRMLDALAGGNLMERISASYQGNFAQLKDNANKTADRISSTIAEIKASAREVTNASAEIATSTTDLSQRTEEQAASLEQTSASMEQIAATVRKNAENAQAANQSAGDTRVVAERGGQVVAQAVGAMAKIEEASAKIADIISVIDEIARQTNLLALNAAVEAARAGEAGRGFAVVASEVRSLAQRSSQAAKDIKELITNSNGLVKDGVDLVNRAGGSLNEIVASINKVVEIVADIANASAEQASGIEQVGKALTQMDEVTQQNSALVEENAATAKTLEHQALAMDQRVAFFRIEDGQGDRPTAGAPARKGTAPALLARGAAERPAPPTRKVAAGPARRMQSGLAVAVKAEPEWQEF
jgi:methyl-accepting chemotaxis protein